MEAEAVAAQVAAIDSFSGHAGRSELAAYVRSLGGTPRRITVVHGDEDQSLAFAELLRGLHPDADVIVPVPNQVVEVGMADAPARR